MLYTVWCIFWFVFIYALLFPIQFVAIQRESWKPFAHWLNRFWGQCFFAIAGIKVDVRYDFTPDPKGVYVFCANHFSYIDIAAMGVVVDNFYAFIGKHGVKNIPALGYMFRKLHIQVNRDQPNSRSYALNKCIKTLADGRSVMIFPEGGIKTKNPPLMTDFQDGAFKMAIQQQVPIVPIALLTNYQIMPDASPFRVHRRTVEAVILPPIDTLGKTQADVSELRVRCYEIITKALIEKV